MNTLQPMLDRSRSVTIANVFAFAVILIASSGVAKGNIYDSAEGSQMSGAKVLHASPPLRISKYVIPEILTPEVPTRMLCACVEGWSRRA